MGYKLDYGALRSLAGTYGGAVSQWKRGLSAVMGQASSIAASTNISGNSADRLKEYLNTAYSCIETSLSILLSLFQENFLLYVDAYSQQVDAAGDAHIEEQELGNLHSRLEAQRHRTQQIAIAAESALQGVSDLVPLPIPDFDVTDTAFGTILTSVYQLNDAVNALESAHVSADFAQIDALIAGLDAHLAELCGQGRELKTAFSASGYAALASVPALLQAASDAYDRMAAQESSVAAAAERLENQLAREQAEMEKRENQAKAVKILTYAAVAIGTAVVIAACPAASPVVIGMASGLVTSAVSASADEYVKHGFEMEQWDTGRIGAHACIGTLTGMIGGAAGTEAGLFVKAGVKGLSGALEGAATTSYDQLVTYGRITDTKAVLVDAAVKGGSSFAGSLIGGAIAKNTKSIGISSLDMARDDPLNKMHGVSVFLYEGGKSMSTGVVSRGVSNLTGQVISLSTDETPGNLGEIDFASVSEDMFSPESMGKDFVVSGAAGAAGDYVGLRTPDPDTGLTPIIQYKLGNTTDPDTGLTPIVQDSLSHIVDDDEFSAILGEIEERNPSNGANAFIEQGDSGETGNQINWMTTANTPEEIEWIKEADADLDEYQATVQTTMDFEEPVHRKMIIPKNGSWTGDPGNSEFVPNDPELRQAMAEYGRDSVTFSDQRVDFSPFSEVDTPWGKIDTKVEIGHMVGGANARQSKTPDGMPGNYEQARAELEKKVLDEYGKAGATQEAVKAWMKELEKGRTWHEDPDRKTMMSVPSIINSKVNHTGGVSEEGYVQAWGDVSHYYGE